MTFRIQRRAVLASLPALWTATRVGAQPAYPSKPILLVVPFAAGGGTDLVARVIAQHMEKKLGQPVLVDNRAGANGNVAGAYVAKARPDGYTVLYNTSSMVISTALYRNMGYDPLKDLNSVGLSASIPMGLIVSPQLPVKTVAEFIAYAKSHPGQLAYGSSGVGNINHMTAVQFVMSLGIDAVHVPYKGSAPATVDLAGNQIQFMLDTVSNIKGFIREGRLNLLATATNKRLAHYPNVPTLTEIGIPNFETGAWSGMMVPAQTPAPIIAALNTALLSALQSPEVLRKLEDQGTQALGSSQQEYDRHLRSEIERWARVARDAKLEMQ